MLLTKKTSRVSSLNKIVLTAAIALTMTVGCGKDQGSSYEGNWKGEEGDSYLTVKFEDNQIKAELLYFDTWSQEFEKDIFPAKIEDGSMYINAGFENIPVIYDSEQDTLTIQGETEYQRFDGNPEEASVKWLEELEVTRAKNKELCSSLNAEIKEWYDASENGRTETGKEISARTKAERPPGCLLDIVWH